MKPKEKAIRIEYFTTTPNGKHYISIKEHMKSIKAERKQTTKEIIKICKRKIFPSTLCSEYKSGWNEALESLMEEIKNQNGGKNGL